MRILASKHPKSLLALSGLLVVAFFSGSVAHAQTKWNPGHYFRAFLQRVHSSPPTSDINMVVNEPALKGMTIPFYWAVLETSQGQYDWSRIDNALAALSAGEKRLIVEVWDHSFDSTPPSEVIPAYLLTPTYNGGWNARQDGGGMAKSWNPLVMDRLIALYTAMADRYDGNPYFEMVSAGETARLVATPTDYTATAFVDQWRRWAEETRNAWPSTNVWLGTNFINGDTSSRDRMVELIAACLDNKIVVGGPDIRANSATPTIGTQVVNGIVGPLGDLRGIIGLRYDQQVIQPGAETPQVVYNNAVVLSNANALKTNYISWTRHTGHATMDWTTDVLPFIRQNPTTIMTKPSSYPAEGTGTYQTESLTVADSSGDPHVVRANDVLLQADANGDYLTFALPNVPAGTYSIEVVVEKGPNRGIFQLKTGDAPTGPFTDRGAPQDTYNPGTWMAGQVLSVGGGVTFSTTGTRYFRFEIVGPSPEGGRSLAVDRITLTPTAPVTYQTESLTVADSSGDPHVVRANDVLLQADANGDYMTFALPNVPSGTYSIEVVVEKGPNRGTFQLKTSAAPTGPFTNRGAPQNTYNAGTWISGQVLSVDSGVTFSTTGTRYFRFEIVAPSPEGGRSLAVDRITLTP